MRPALVSICVGAFSYLLTYLVKRWAWTRGVVDSPNIRSSHVVPTARGGGLAIVAAFSIGIGLLCLQGLFDCRLGLVLVGCSFSVAAIGFIDDLINVSPLMRLAVHLAAATAAVALIGAIPIAWIGEPLDHGSLVSFLLSVVAIVWATNLFNFMDGIDGIAASEAIFIGLATSFLNWSVGGDERITMATICLAASCAGFLIWNWPPASIFMGDVGSGFLGFVLGFFTLLVCRQSAAMASAWLILWGVFIVDATVTLVRRIVRQDKWLQPHRTHAYQHMAQRCGSHAQVTALVSAVNLLWLLPWAWVVVSMKLNAFAGIAIALFPLLIGTLVLKAGVPIDRS